MKKNGQQVQTKKTKNTVKLRGQKKMEEQHLVAKKSYKKKSESAKKKEGTQGMQSLDWRLHMKKTIKEGL